LGLGLRLFARCHCPTFRTTLSYLYLGTTKWLSLPSPNKKKILNNLNLLREKGIEVNIYHQWEDIPLPKSIFILGIPYYLKQYKDFYQKFINRFKNTEGLNQSTRSHFSRLWIRNYIANLHIFSSGKIPVIDFHSFPLRNKLFVFVGASPKLEEEIFILKKFRKKFWLLSSDTALGFLLHENITPDAILSIDAGRGTFYHFLKNLPFSIPVITWFGGNREIFFNCSNIGIFFTTYPFDQILQSSFYPDQPILHNPSLNVAGMALAFAKQLKAKKILFAGTSFVSIDGKSHCKGTGYESYRLPVVSRRLSLESYRTGYNLKMNQKNLMAQKEIFSDALSEFLDPNLIQEFEDFETKNFSTVTKQFDFNLFKQFLKVSSNLDKIASELGVSKAVIRRYIL
jgi:uncharacterized Rossmann fold enzyme